MSKAYEAGTTLSGVANHQIDTFLFDSASQQYVGRLCHFNQCPKGKQECLTQRCGVIKFNKQIEGFVPDDALLTRAVMLYKRGTGRVGFAAELPQPN